MAATSRPCRDLAGLIASLALYDGVNLWCNRDGRVFGLTLTRRVLASSLTPTRAIRDYSPDRWPEGGPRPERVARQRDSVLVRIPNIVITETAAS